MDEFSKWLDQRGIDCQGMARELRDALRAQFDQEQEATRPPETVIVILDGADDDQWQKALRMEVATCG